jgi:hypothetical protein
VKSKNSSEAPVISIMKLLHGDRYPSARAIDRPIEATVFSAPALSTCPIATLAALLPLRKVDPGL